MYYTCICRSFGKFYIHAAGLFCSFLMSRCIILICANMNVMYLSIIWKNNRDNYNFKISKLQTSCTGKVYLRSFHCSDWTHIYALDAFSSLFLLGQLNQDPLLGNCHCPQLTLKRSTLTHQLPCMFLLHMELDMIIK